MIEALYWLAVAAAVIGAFAKNRAAWALLAGVALTAALDAAGVQFSLFFWALIDLAVVLAIIHPGLRYRDCIVLALFIPAWVFYFLEPDTRYFGVTLVVAAQLLLTFPILRTSFLARKVWGKRNQQDTDNMEMVFV